MHVARFEKDLTSGTEFTADTIVDENHSRTTAPTPYTATAVLFSTRSHCKAGHQSALDQVFKSWESRPVLATRTLSCRSLTSCSTSRPSSLLCAARIRRVLEALVACTKGALHPKLASKLAAQAFGANLVCSQVQRRLAERGAAGPQS